MAKSVMTAQEWKEKGNEEFSKGNWSNAISHYTNGLKLIKEDNAEKGVYYKNRAAVYLKLHDYEKVVEDCDSALKKCCNKALYRRCQALEALERFEEAYRDAEIIISSDPNNKVIQPVATRLFEIVQERRKENVSQMLDLAFNVSADNGKRETAMNNLLVLARERAGAEEIFKKEGVSKLVQLVKVEKNEEVICTAIRIIGELCKNNINRTESVMKFVGLPWCLEIMNSTSIQRVNTSQYCLQNILNTYSGMNNKPDSKPDDALCAAHKEEIDTILSCLLNSVTSRTITGLARDAIIELIMRNIHCVTALDWAERFVELRGLQKLMEVAGEMEGYKYNSSIDITSSTRTKTSMCLTKIYENMYYDAAKEKFINAIEEFIKDKSLSPDTESKVRIVLAITTLIFGPLDVANVIICKKEVIGLILAMAKTDDVLQQKMVCECIVAAITNCNKANIFIWRGRNILQNLYYSKHDSIRIRALVGLCKLTNFEDALCSPTIKLFPHGAAKELAKVCRRFLINYKKEKDMIKWALKGLSYLTFDDDVKDELIEDQQAIRAMMELTKTDDQSISYGVLVTLINLCNAYEEQEHIPEILELITVVRHHFADKHVVADDENDARIRRRLCMLAKAGMTSTLVNLSKTDSRNIKELTATVLNAICIPDEIREIIVQQGGTKALLSLAQDSTYKTKKEASRALVHLAHALPPEVAFPGQIIMEVVRPMVNLLNPECSADENCETVTALCNLAKVSDTMRGNIFKEGVFQKIEAFVYGKDILLKVASLALIGILLSNHEVAIQCFEEDKSRVKHLMLLCKDKNQDTKFAAAAILMALTAANREACKKVFDSNSWLESLRLLLTNPEGKIQERGIIIVINMLRSSKDVAVKLMETDIMKILTVLTKNDTVPINIKELASVALKEAADRSGNEERRQAIIVMIERECDRARLSGQLDLLSRLLRDLWAYELVENIPTNVDSEIAKVLEGTERR
ncbi:protein unc-45 homolog B-like [Temnothorax longispinosus]|uniref:protein unc-45 homolog B-like n=1 Tax=Temnothorax longispinosus TaxID=300112 RepID=UPI003A98E3E5